MDKRILISCPVNSREWILPYYLKYIYNLKYDKQLIDIYWIANNIQDDSLLLLQEFKNKYKNEYNSIQIEIYNKGKFKDERTTLTREKYTYNLLVELRNKMLSKCVQLNCDFLFNCDCDVLVSPTLLNDLLIPNKDICASLIYNGYLYADFDNAYKYPNILKYENGQYIHIVNYYVKNPDKAPKDKIIEVGATGACCLISNDVCKNTYYKWHQLGEDLGWSDVCREKGYKMYCLPHCYSQHIMSSELLNKFNYI